jgi:hypothetical protein
VRVARVVVYRHLAENRQMAYIRAENEVLDDLQVVALHDKGALRPESVQGFFYISKASRLAAARRAEPSN